MPSKLPEKGAPDDPFVKNEKQTLYIVEPVANGHRMVYVRRIARAAAASGLKITVVTLQKSIQHKSFKLMAAELQDRISIAFLRPTKLERFLIDSRRPTYSQLGWYLIFRSFSRMLPDDGERRVFLVPQLDYCDKVVSLFGSPFGDYPWGGLVMQYKFHYTSMNALRPPEPGDAAKERAFGRLLKNKTLRKLFVIDELLFEYASRKFRESEARLEYVADPVDMAGTLTKAEARARLSIPLNKKVIMIYGALHLRKGIPELILAASTAGFPPNVVIFLAGSQGDDLNELMRSRVVQQLKTKKVLIEADRYLDDEEEYAAFRASDIVWVGYRQFYGMSGVLVQAGKAGLPVISCQDGLIGWMTKKYKLGVTIDVDSTQQIIQAINDLTTDEAASSFYGAQGAALAEGHTSEGFATKIIYSLFHDRKPIE